MREPSFAADAAAGFDETPARGPYTLAMGNSVIYLSLPNMTVDHMAIVESIRAIANNGSAHSHLPIEYNNDPTLIAGYIRQLSVLAEFYANPKAPSIEVPWSTGSSFRAIMLHPLSRGAVRLNLPNHLAHLKYLWHTFDTPTMRRYGVVETDPGVAKQDNSMLREYEKIA